MADDSDEITIQMKEVSHYTGSDDDRNPGEIADAHDQMLNSERP